MIKVQTYPELVEYIVEIGIRPKKSSLFTAVQRLIISLSNI